MGPSFQIRKMQGNWIICNKGMNEVLHLSPIPRDSGVKGGVPSACSVFVRYACSVSVRVPYTGVMHHETWIRSRRGLAALLSDFGPFTV